MKKITKQFRAKVVNDSLFYIYKYIDTPISLDELAQNSSISKYHFHRIFKEETGYTIFEMISSIRLQKAANLLIVNKFSTVSQTANACGYSSHSSFIKAFKKKFKYTPKEWKNFGYKEYSKNIIKHFPNKKKISTITPIIKPCEAIKCIYLRHKGYNKKIKQTWEKLQAISYELDIPTYRQIALQHDNPTLTPLENASYIAAMEIREKVDVNFSTLEIPKSICAVFNFKGKYGDLLNLMRYVYHFWLPNSGYETKTLPSYCIYKKNYYLENTKTYELDFYIPIKVIY